MNKEEFFKSSIIPHKELSDKLNKHFSIKDLEKAYKIMAEHSIIMKNSNKEDILVVLMDIDNDGNIIDIKNSDDESLKLDIADKQTKQKEQIYNSKNYSKVLKNLRKNSIRAFKRKDDRELINSINKILDNETEEEKELRKRKFKEKLLLKLTIIMLIITLCILVLDKLNIYTVSADSLLVTITRLIIVIIQFTCISRLLRDMLERFNKEH